MKQKILKILKNPIFIIGIAVAIYYFFIKKGTGFAKSTSFSYGGNSTTIPLEQINNVLGSNPNFESNLKKWKELDFFKTALPDWWNKYIVWVEATGVQSGSGNHFNHQDWQKSWVLHDLAVMLSKEPLAFIAKLQTIQNYYFLFNLNQKWVAEYGVPMYLQIFYYTEKQSDIDSAYSHFKKANDWISETFNK